MRKKKVWRYYCDHCKKSGCSKFHLERHEKACTMNPGRRCGVCWMMGEKQGPIGPLVATLPNPDYYRTGTTKAYEAEFTDLGTPSLAALPTLREAANNCPACILAAIRQSGIPPGMFYEFRWKDEMAAVLAEFGNSYDRERYD